jgi:hypothetical protein
MPVIAMQPSRQLGGAMIGVLVGLSIGSLAERRLNEAFGHAVCPWRIESSADVLEAEVTASIAESEGFVAGAIVGHDPSETSKLEPEFLFFGAIKRLDACGPGYGQRSPNCSA